MYFITIMAKFVINREYRQCIGTLFFVSILSVAIFYLVKAATQKIKDPIVVKNNTDIYC